METAAADISFAGGPRSPVWHLMGCECGRPVRERRFPAALRRAGGCCWRLIRLVLLAIILNDGFEFYPSPVRPVTEAMHRVAIIQTASRVRQNPSV